MINYKTTFKDKFGTEYAEFQSNGSELRIELRGIQFTGNCFEQLEGKIDFTKFEYEEFENTTEIGNLHNANK